MTALTIQILDVTSGKMAEGVLMQNRKIIDGDWQPLADASTNAGGRAILAENDTIKNGGYFEVLVFLGAFFDATGRDLPQIKLVDIVPLRFGLEPGIGAVDIHMSVTPHGYTVGFVTDTKRLTLE